MSNFDDALKLSLGYEGPDSNTPGDRGKLTSHGVTQVTYDRWRRLRGLPLRPVTAIEDVEVCTIYQDEYWKAAHCDELTPALAKCVFDAAVQHGAGRAVKLLQQAVGVGDDGHFGPVTRAAVQAMPEQEVISNYIAARQDYYDEIIDGDPTQVKFRDGWENRLALLHGALLA